MYDSTTTLSDPYFDLTAGGDLEWHKIVFVRSASGFTLYVDNLHDAVSGSTIGELDVPEGGAIVGQEQDGVGTGFSDRQNWNGKMDDIRIYNRALSSNEVARLYAETAPNPDMDGDGMDDAWEMEMFGNLDQSAAGDYDADGRTNAEEEADGTDPTDPGSTLGLVAYYPFDGDAEDKSGNAFHGVWAGGEGYQDGIRGQAGLFDGLDNNITVPNNATLDGLTGEHTLSAWVYVNSTNNMDIISKDGEYNDRQYILNQTPFNTFQAHVGLVGQRLEIVPGSTEAWVQHWYHVIQVHNNGHLALFVNGRKDAEKIISDYTGPLSGPEPLRIGGGAPRGSQLFFDGLIDDVRIYNRALSSNEVARLYAETATTNTPSTLKPDLSLSSADLRILNAFGVETANPAVGESVKFEVTVHNLGETNTSDNVLVQVFEGPGPRDLSNYNSNEVASLVSGMITESIPVGGSATVLIPWTVDGSDRMATLTTVAEFESNRTASQLGSALPIEELSLDNNRVGQSVQIGLPSGDYGIDVIPRIPAVITEGKSFTLSGLASYDWGGNEPVLGALATITVNGEEYTDRTASPDGSWSVLVNGLPASNYVAHVEIDDGRLVGQTNLTLAVNGADPTIDLRIKQIAFESGTYRSSGETGYAVTGDGVVLKALVRNDGNADSSAFSVSFNDSTTPYSSVTTNLPAFAERWITAPSGWTALAGSSTLTVTADSDDDVLESSETNNERGCTVIGSEAKPDLIVTDISWPAAKDGDALTITATVKNQGGATLTAGSSFEVLFTIDGAAVATETVTLPSDLSSGSSTTVETSWIAEAGSHSISVEADSGDVIAEDVEINNIRTETLTVREALPDLRPFYYLYGREGSSYYYRTGLSFSPAQPVAGEAVTVSCDVYNNGTVSLPAGTTFNVRFLADGVQFANSGVAYPVGVEGIAPGEKLTISATWNSTTSETVSFSVVVDNQEQVTEENENNNTTSKSLTVYPVEADLEAAGLSFSPSQPLPGSAVTLTAHIRNNGGSAGGIGEPVEFFEGTTNNLIGSTNLVADVAAKGGTATASLEWVAPGVSGSYPMIASVAGTFYTNTLTVTENPAPNLQVFSEDISVSPALPNSGENVTVMANIRNLEGSTATNFNVRFSYDRTPGAPPVPLATVPVDALAVGSNRTVTATDTILAENSAYSLKVEILPNDEQGDADEGDNVATSSFLLADTPNADAGADTSCFVGQTVVFDGSGSANASNYIWTVSSAPEGSTALLTGADTESPSLTPDLPGTYELQLIVDNGVMSSTPDTVTVTSEWIEWVVESAHGTPVPDIGTNLVEYGAVLTNTVEAAVTNGAARYQCLGYGEPLEGGTTNLFVVTATNHETVVWNWSTNYWLDAEVNGQGQVTGGDVWIAAGSNATLTATPADGWRVDHWLLDGQPEGWTTNGVDWIEVVMDAATTAACFFVELTLAEAVDNHDLTWTIGGSSNWFGQIQEMSDSQDAAQSGHIGDAESSWIETTVPCSGTLSFRWKVSSEDRYDWLWFEVDGDIWRVIYGETDWHEVYLAIDGAGAHKLRWEYSKDKTLSYGDDCGWLDQIIWTPDYEGFALWANQHGLTGDAAALFGQDRDGDGVPNGIEYAFGTNGQLRIQMVDGQPVAEVLRQNEASVPYVDVRVLGSTNLVNWTLPVQLTNGAPMGYQWHKPESTPDKAFFKLEAELK